MAENSKQEYEDSYHSPFHSFPSASSGSCSFFEGSAENDNSPVVTKSVCTGLPNTQGEIATQVAMVEIEPALYSKVNDILGMLFDHKVFCTLNRRQPKELKSIYKLMTAEGLEWANLCGKIKEKLELVLRVLAKITKHVHFKSINGDMLAAVIYCALFEGLEITEGIYNVNVVNRLLQIAVEKGSWRAFALQFILPQLQTKGIDYRALLRAVFTEVQHVLSDKQPTWQQVQIVLGRYFDIVNFALLHSVKLDQLSSNSLAGIVYFVIKHNKKTFPRAQLASCVKLAMENNSLEGLVIGYVLKKSASGTINEIDDLINSIYYLFNSDPKWKKIKIILNNNFSLTLMIAKRWFSQLHHRVLSAIVSCALDKQYTELDEQTRTVFLNTAVAKGSWKACVIWHNLTLLEEDIKKSISYLEKAILIVLKDYMDKFTPEAVCVLCDLYEKQFNAYTRVKLKHYEKLNAGYELLKNLKSYSANTSFNSNVFLSYLRDLQKLKGEIMVPILGELDYVKMVAHFIAPPQFILHYEVDEERNSPSPK